MSDNGEGESFVEWQERMVDTILRMHDRGCSENQIRFWFGAQADKRMKIDATQTIKAIEEEIRRCNLMVR